MLPLKRLEKSNTTDNLWIYILRLLKKQPLYGWEIPGLIEQEFGFKTGKITPYRVLYRLQIDKFVTSALDERRRTYKITGKGEKELEQGLSFLEEMIKKIS